MNLHTSAPCDSHSDTVKMSEEGNSSSDEVINSSSDFVSNSLMSTKDIIEPSSDNVIKSSNDVVYNWVDITREFIESSSHLDLGELLHDSK